MLKQKSETHYPSSSFFATVLALANEELKQLNPRKPCMVHHPNEGGHAIQRLLKVVNDVPEVADLSDIVGSIKRQYTNKKAIKITRPHYSPSLSHLLTYLHIHTYPRTHRRAQFMRRYTGVSIVYTNTGSTSSTVFSGSGPSGGALRRSATFSSAKAMMDAMPLRQHQRLNGRK